MFVVPYAIRQILRFLFGNAPSQAGASKQQGRQHSSSSDFRAQAKNKKVIPKDEGEYVDYVEIKDK
jgi:hypothetical protein